MKLSTIKLYLALFAAACEAATSQKCSTKYASTSTKVTTSTRLVTRTATVTVTSTNSVTGTVVDPAKTVTKTSFVRYDTTFYFTEAETTQTIPVPHGFTPMASATTDRGVPPQKRKPGQAEGRAPSSYPYQVVCTNYKTVTSTSTYELNYEFTTTTSTQFPRTITKSRTYTTWRATTVTEGTATRTVHAACASDNIIDTFNFRGINGWDTNGGKLNVGAFSDPSDPLAALTQAAQQSPQDCCEAALAAGFSGFEYYGSPGYSGQCIGSSGASVSIFYIGPYSGSVNGHLWCGNGPGGNPTFGGYYDPANLFS